MGLPTGEKNRFGDARYHLSFWSAPYRTDNGCPFHIPYMSGYGGNLVVLLPNGISAFRFADGNNFDVESMVLAGETIRPFCSAPVENLPASLPKGQRLTASELYTEFSGHTFYGDGWQMFPAAGGAIYRKSKDAISGGTWRIAPDGQFCRAWWEARRERCYNVYQEGEKFELYLQDSWGKVEVKRAPGNPEGY